MRPLARLGLLESVECQLITLRVNRVRSAKRFARRVRNAHEFDAVVMCFLVLMLIHGLIFFRAATCQFAPLPCTDYRDD